MINWTAGDRERKNANGETQVFRTYTSDDNRWLIEKWEASAWSVWDMSGAWDDGTICSWRPTLAKAKILAEELQKASNASMCSPPSWDDTPRGEYA